ncbi:IPT/TIG domain-containing protein [Paractinoplanes durhamensis]|uniref:IPT/TIG domain-containing protein n=1 Tax=Paractinoplanes durhamensis TaxID=113563 RepID=UPI003645B926
MQDFVIGAGPFLVGGLEVSSGADVTYTSQNRDGLTAPTPAQPNPRIDTVYLDAFLIEVDYQKDDTLTNPDVGMPTSVRLKPHWVVRVAEGEPVPPAADGHAVYPLATLTRPSGVPTIRADMITDLRQRRLTVADMEQRLSLMEKVLLIPAFVPAPGAEFSPRSGPVGQPVTLKGINFDVSQPVVLFGSVPGTLIGTPTARQIAVAVPGGLTPTDVPVKVPITVRNPGGETVSRESFTVRADPAFGLPGHQFDPASGSAGTTVTLFGFNFAVSPPSVRFDTVDADVVGVPTPTSLTVEVPRGLVPAGQTSAEVNITITTTAGSDVSEDAFRVERGVLPPVFAATPFRPRSNPIGQSVTLFGTNFDVPPVSVKFGDTPAQISAAPSANEISCLIPAVPQPIPPNGLEVPITVTTGGGTATALHFVILS